MSTPPVVIIIGPHAFYFTSEAEAAAFFRERALASQDPAGDGSSES